jgi:hypothetical protein
VGGRYATDVASYAYGTPDSSSDDYTFHARGSELTQRTNATTPGRTQCGTDKDLDA